MLDVFAEARDRAAARPDGVREAVLAVLREEARAAALDGDPGPRAAPGLRRSVRDARDVRRRMLAELASRRRGGDVRKDRTGVYALPA